MRVLWAFLLLPLVACFDAEADLSIAEDETVRADVKMSVARELYDTFSLTQGGRSPCPSDSELSVGPTVTCAFSESSTFEEVVEDVKRLRAQDKFLENMRLERVNKDTVRLSVPLDFENAPRPPELSEGNPMFQNMVTGLAGGNIVIRVHGHKIIETNGSRSSDSKTATLVLPTVELLNPSGSLPDSFNVTLQYRRCGSLGLLCK